MGMGEAPQTPTAASGQSPRRRRALISVYDKAGLVELGKGLEAQGFEIYATGSTAQRLLDAGVRARDVASLTGFPEILGGRVKTLHPAVFGAILARPNNAQDLADMVAHGLAPFELVVCNLYPFAAALAAQAHDAELIEQIDIGGVSLLRAAAKNHEHVIVLADPLDYEGVLNSLKKGPLDLAQRRDLALRAFRLTSAYDALIADALCARVPVAHEPAAAGRSQQSGATEAASPVCTRHRQLVLEQVKELRYGENPHQRAALFRASGHDACGAGGRPGATFDLTRVPQLGGKELSYNNYLDAEHALRLAAELPQNACVIVKHNMPCGVGVARTEHGSSAASLEAFELAFAADPVSPFGGVVQFTGTVCGRTASRLGEIFLEIVAAPMFTPEALTILTQKKNLRLLQIAPHAARLETEVWTQIQGGFLLQQADAPAVLAAEAQDTEGRALGQGVRSSLQLAWAVAKHVRSNAIVFADEHRTLAIAGGFTNRVDAMRRCTDLYRGFCERRRQEGVLEPLPFVVASDGFFPFADNMDVLEGLPVLAVIQPGGSVRDPEVLARASQMGIPMVLTGERHFKH
jgi:phosphoribosylaminoimidazolecarboxamide formyltransferase/IMP cyclohydrolase